MTTDSHPAFLHRLIPGRKRRRDIELADMGTAFALDQSFDEGAAPGTAAQAPTPSRWSMRFWLGRKAGA
jgi:hypothetical protein